MEFHGKHSVCVLLMGMLFCTAGCAATEQNPSANHTKATDLPPLVTDTSEATTDILPKTVKPQIRKKSGLPLDKLDGNGYNEDRKSIPVDGCSQSKNGF